MSSPAEGEFTVEQDREKLVDICLGLWATAYYQGQTESSIDREQSLAAMSSLRASKRSGRQNDGGGGLGGESSLARLARVESVCGALSMNFAHIVSEQKEHIFPKAYFGNLVSLLEREIDLKNIEPELSGMNRRRPPMFASRGTRDRIQNVLSSSKRVLHIFSASSRDLRGPAPPQPPASNAGSADVAHESCIHHNSPSEEASGAGVIKGRRGSNTAAQGSHYHIEEDQVVVHLPP